MATIASTIARALRLLRVQDANEAPEAEDTSTALDALNAMMARWAANGLAPEWAPVTEPSSELAVPAQATDAVVFNLAMRLSSEYGAALTDAQVETARHALMNVWRDRISPASAETTSAGSAIYRALRLISGSGVPNLPDQFSLPGALVALNSQMQRWLADGLVDAWSDLDEVSDTLPVSPGAMEAVAYNLAVRLQPEYGVTPQEALAAAASASIARLWKDRIAPGSTSVSTAGAVIMRALRILAGAGAGALPDTVDFPAGIVALNGLMARWVGNGLVESWTPASSPASDVPYTAEKTDAIAHALALRLQPEYGVAMSESALESASSAVMALWRDRIAATSVDETSVGSVVLRALRILSGTGVSTMPDRFSLPAAILALNTMLRRWEANVVPLGWRPVSDLSDTLPIPVEAVEAVAYNLAVRLRPEYGVALSQDVLQAAEDGLNLLRRDVYVSARQELAVDVPRHRHYNMRTDTYY